MPPPHPQSFHIYFSRSFTQNRCCSLGSAGPLVFKKLHILWQLTVFVIASCRRLSAPSINQWTSCPWALMLTWGIFHRENVWRNVFGASCLCTLFAGNFLGVNFSRRMSTVISRSTVWDVCPSLHAGLEVSTCSSYDLGFGNLHTHTGRWISISYMQ